MKDIIRWLREIEHLANDVYSQAAILFSDDADFKRFLEHTAEDEAWHYHVMGSAAEYMSTEPDTKPAIKIDEKTHGKIIKYFNAMSDGVERGTISKTEIINNIVEVELSEWNDIFLYVVNFLKNKTSEFKYPAARMQAHIKEIEHYLEIIEGRPEDLQKIKELPPIWVENILIVDDEEMISQLIMSLLNRSGNIDIAHNGSDALKLMETKYYKLIISDIDMPKMDGLTFYKEAVEKYPLVSKKFLFITGDLSAQRRDFFKEEQVRYLEKPINISQLREDTSKIIVSD
jgi:CheY-like chemotaxis protein/rubrerythrin